MVAAAPAGNHAPREASTAPHPLRAGVAIYSMMQFWSGTCGEIDPRVRRWGPKLSAVSVCEAASQVVIVVICQ